MKKLKRIIVICIISLMFMVGNVCCAKAAVNIYLTNDKKDIPESSLYSNKTLKKTITLSDTTRDVSLMKEVDGTVQEFKGTNSDRIQILLSNTSNMYCVQRSSTTAGGGGEYEIIAKLSIDGKKCVLEKRGENKIIRINNNYAKLARVLHGSGEKGFGLIYWMDHGSYTKIQVGVWNVWNAVASSFGSSMRGYQDTHNTDKLSEEVLKFQKNENLVDDAKNLLEAASEYADNYDTKKKNYDEAKCTLKIDNKVDIKTEIKTGEVIKKEKTLTTDDSKLSRYLSDGNKNVKWARIGPIILSTNTTKNKLSVDYPDKSVFFEANNKLTSKIEKSAKWNNDKKTNKFYVYVKYTDYKEVDSKFTFKLSRDVEFTNLKARVYYLEKGGSQDFILVYLDKDNNKKTVSTTLDLKFNKSFSIKKTDISTGITLTKGIKFRFKDKSGNYLRFKVMQVQKDKNGNVKKDKNGNKIYTELQNTSKLEEAQVSKYVFIGVTSKNGESINNMDDSTWIYPSKTIEGMKIGTYNITEMLIDSDKVDYYCNSKYTKNTYYGGRKGVKEKYNIRDIGNKQITFETNRIEIENKKITKSLQILKVDKDNNTIALSGIQFILVYKFKGREYLVNRVENNKTHKVTFTYTERTESNNQYISIKKEYENNKDKMTVFETGEDGYIHTHRMVDGEWKDVNYISGLDVGTYYLYEVSNGGKSDYKKPNINEKVEAVYTEDNKEKVTTKVTVSPNEMKKYKVYNEKKSYGGKLKIYKKDVNTNIPIPNMEFKIKYLKTKEIEITKNGKKIKKTAIIGEQYVVQDNNGKVTYVDDVNEATVFKSNENGILQGYNSKGEKVDYIGGLKSGQYKAIELKQDGNGTYSSSVDFEISEAADEYVNSNDRTKDDFTKIEVTEDNDKDTYRIYNTMAPMKGNVSIEGKVWSPKKADDKAQETVSEQQAIEYNDEYNLVKGIKVNIYAKARLIVTTKETGETYFDEKTGKVTEYGEQLKYYEFDPSNGHAYQVDENGSRIKNKNGNDIDLGEELVIKKGTIVSSKMVSYSEEKLVSTVYTDEKGKYISTLRGVPYPDTQLPYYRVEFQYDGMDFQGARIAKYDNKENGSKAIENTARRTVINNAYETIKGNGTKNGGIALNSNRNLEYTFKEGNDNGYGTSTSKGLSTGYKKSDKLITVNDIGKATNDVKNNNMITASYSLKKDNPTENPGALGDYDDSTDEKETYYNDTQKKVEGINLMLMEREMPDLSVSNRIESVVTSINGYNNLYKTIASKDDDDPDNAAINLQVKYVQDEERLGKIPVYPSDVAAFDITNTELKQRLQLYITYKVSIVNNSATLYNRVKELALYYNTEGYELLYVGTGLDNTKNNYCAKNDMAITANKYSGNTIPLTGYSRVCIDLNNTVIEPGDNKSKDLYITYKIKDDYVKGAINGNNNIKSLKHIAEINAYSTYSDTEGKNAYAGVDKNSAPGNITNSDIKFNDSKPIIGSIDNDTGIARAAGLNVQENRTMTGTVFLDNSNVENNKRLGDGIYDKNNEKALAGVKVKLEIVNKENNNIITGENIATQMPKNIVIKDQDNKYHSYKVINENGKYYYLYNNLKIEIYTATTSETGNDNNYKISGYIPGNYKLTYTYNNETYYKGSDGKQHKINTEDYKSTIVQDVDSNTIIKSAFEDNNNNMDWYMVDNASTEEELQKEFTRYNEAVDDMNTRKTIDNYYSNMNMTNTGNTNDSLIKNKNYDMTASTPVMGIPVEKTISIDTTSTGNELKNLSYDIKNMDFGIVERPRQSLKLEKKINSVKIRLANGQLLVDVKADDNGKFQTVQGVQIINGAVHIEFDNELIHGSTLELGYKVKAINNSELDYTTESFYKYGIEGTKDERVKLSPQEILDYVDNNLIYTKDDNSKWNIINKGDYTNKIDNAEIYDNTEKSKINTILSYNIKENNNSIELAPGDTYNNIPEIKLEKLLSNTQDDEMLYGNKVEVITVNQGKAKEGNNNLGRRINIQLGTYNKAGDSGIGAKAENVTITPPTGQDNISKIYYAIIALGVLVIIAGGIVLIRHNIKKNK